MKNYTCIPSKLVIYGTCLKRNIFVSSNQQTKIECIKSLTLTSGAYDKSEIFNLEE